MTEDNTGGTTSFKDAQEAPPFSNNRFWERVAVVDDAESDSPLPPLGTSPTGRCGFSWHVGLCLSAIALLYYPWTAGAKELTLVITVASTMLIALFLAAPMVYFVLNSQTVVRHPQRGSTVSHEKNANVVVPPPPTWKGGKRHNPTDVSIAIVGAGAAGLQTAYTLVTKYGYRVEDLCVLEARDRVGGRIHTISHPVPTKQQSGRVQDSYIHMDTGAAWVHGTQPLQGNMANPMLQYLNTTRDLRAVAKGNPWMRPWTVLHQGRGGSVPLDGDQGEVNTTTHSAKLPSSSLIQIFYHGERLVQQDSTKNPDSLVRMALEQYFDVVQRYLPERARALFSEGRGMETASVNVMDILRDLPPKTDASKEEQKPIELLRDFYLYLMTAWYGKSLSELQLSIFSGDENDRSQTKDKKDAPPDWMYVEEGDFPGPHCVVSGGMTKLLDPLLEKVGSSVQIEHEVQEIWQDENNRRIRLHCKSGETYTAQAVAVTLPINVIRDEHSTLFARTPLSHAKSEAMKYISLGKYKKVMLTFDHIFWPVEPPFLGLLRPKDSFAENSGLGPCLLIDNLWALEGHACWEAILVGESADWATHRKDAVIQHAVLDFVHHALGVSRADLTTWCTGCHVTRWEEDPFSRGAYASLCLGALPRHVESLAANEWEGALVFAGDAVIEDFEGGVHAALFSGIEAARQVHQYLSSQVGDAGFAG